MDALCYNQLLRAREGVFVLDRREEGPITIISCNEDITSENYEQFREQYKAAIASIGSDVRLILNLTDIERIASAALGLIADSYPKIIAQGAKMRLVAQSEEVLRLLNVTRLSRVIRVDPDLETAMHSFK